eukprot:GDKJ01002131.1.p1 GENE.GDKJ01002131.1~~GDKJ01002131.1.p1  ORF type:complete len:277 (-),score=57.93 GDKJ01002131.1:59-766(-)
MNKYDESHDFDHVLRVVALSIHIFNGECPSIKPELRQQCYIIVLYASLLHDVVDHKYSDSADAQVFSKLLANLDPKVVKIIEDIIAGVSYSKEVKNGLKHLEEYESELPFFLMRNIVSDADKIDAIGDIGIRRCGIYTLNKILPNGADYNTPEVEKVVLKRIVDHCDEKLLVLHENFIRTGTGKAFARHLHKDVENYAKATRDFLNGKVADAPVHIWKPELFRIATQEVVGVIAK